TLAVSGAAPFSTALDTDMIADGSYDFRVVAVDTSGNLIYSTPLRGLLIDNTAPTARLRSPGTTLSGRTTLTATADDNGSGMASVRCERSAAGAGTWVPFGSSRVAPYAVVFKTSSVPNGLYDLRVVATDRAGHTYASPPVTGITITNPPAVLPA